MRVGVVGAGAMGTGIGRVAAAKGDEVLLYDVRAGVASEARGRVAESLQRQLTKGRSSNEEVQQILGRIAVTEELDDLAACDLVIEAVEENLSVKQQLFADLEAIVSPYCILASNTSSLSIGAVFRATAHPERTVGLHFFNPAHVMELVEVVPGPRTSAETLATVQETVRSAGKTPVVAQDAPGFIVNFAGRAYNVEALATVQEGVASPFQVDRIMQQGFNFPMGPFALMDLTGMDVNFPVTDNIFMHNFGEPMLRSTWEHRYLYEAGLLGRKTGRGFFSYPRVDNQAPERTPSPQACKVVLAGGTEERAALQEFCEHFLIDIVADDGTSPVLVAPIGEEATSVAARLHLNPKRVVAVDLAFGLRAIVTLMANPATDPTAITVLQSQVACAGVAVEVINDSPGFVAQRILAAVVNLGSEMAQRGIAAPTDIDLAVELGLRYPQGPLALADTFGATLFTEILAGIHCTTRDPRYRASPWLRRRAAARVPIHHPDLIPVRANRAD